MIDGLKPYPEYCNAGLAWAGHLPKHWQAVRMKHVLRERSIKGYPEEPLLAATQTKGVVRKNEYENRTVLALKDLHLLKLVCQKDFVISLRSFQGGIEYARHRGIISPAYTILYPSIESNHGYLSWLFKSKPYIENLKLHVTGIRQGQNIDYERLKRSPIPLAPPDEQAAIVKYLDYVDRRVRRYVRAKRRLIALLEEQKQAIIHQAVTRGLDPDVKLKPSGIDWLGDIPEHWEVKRIKYLMQVIDRRSETGEEVLLSMRKYHGLVPYHEHFSKPPQAASLKGFKIIEKGQIAVNRMQAGFGLIFASPQRGLVSPDFGVFQPTGEVIPEFLGEVFRSRIVRAKFHSESKGLGTGKCGFMRLYDDRIGWVPIAYPPTTEEQSAILRKMAQELHECDAPIHNAENQILLLLEYRTRLIADVVTGKLDVRDAAARLPDESDTDEPSEPDNGFDEDIPDDESDLEAEEE